MGKDKSVKNQSRRSAKDTDWERRVLCSDGNCIGVIGPDGRCKECGKPYEGQLPWQSPSEPSPAQSEATVETEDTVEFEETEANEPDPMPVSQTDSEADVSEISDDDWENRKLCSDGNCIGVIGPDGRCKECGKPYQGDA